MPAIIEMRLKATWDVRPDTRRLHGLACALFENEDADHDGPSKPFAVWPLQPGSAPGEWDWRASWLSASAPPPAALAADTLRVGHVSCVVDESRNRRVTHAALAGGRPLASVTVAFRSPAYFSQDGAEVVTPEPRLIVGSWCRRWNASLPEGSPLAIGDGEWRGTSRLLSLAAFDLRTERRDTGHGRDARASPARLPFAWPGTLPPGRGRSSVPSPASPSTPARAPRPRTASARPR